MPTYDYRCVATGEVVEVRHSMRETLTTWGELCAAAGISSGETPLQSPVERLATGGQVVQSRTLKNPEAPPCASGGGCCGGGQMCGF
ncbi:zinc ribbon domain-containing protein [Motiliproteus sp. SC1-56]|uniref:zinc ribbon domain-containing protein n=1 Tax=Motiliproteus sp. SC1-56 TaxID=2799565 RepID=UPI001A8F849F|nr:zinc ribbon domain-containing protein [Motiliproteus sp. SC1-56]